MLRIICTLTYFLFTTTLNAQTAISLTLPNEESAEVARIFRELISEFNASNTSNIVLDVHDSWDKAINSFSNDVRSKKKAGILLAKNAQTLDLRTSSLVTNYESLSKADRSFFDRFVPRYLSNVTGSDKHYAIPLYCTVPAMYYNLDKIQAQICDDKIFSTSNLPKSWQDLENLLINLRGQTNQPPMLIGGDWYEWIFETMVLQNGALLANNVETVKFDSPEAIAALKFWQKLWDSSLIDTTNSWKATINNFKYQNYPIVCYSSGAMQTLSNEIKFQWTGSAMPSNKTKMVSYAGASLFFSSNMTVAQQQLAVKFVDFLYKKDISAQIASATGLIAVTPNERATASRFDKELGAQNVLKQIDTAKPTFMTYRYSKMRKLLKDAIARVFNGHATVEQSLGRAQKEARHILGY